TKSDLIRTYYFTNMTVIKKYILPYEDDDNENDGDDNNQPVIHQFDPHKSCQYNSIKYECGHDNDWICIHLIPKIFKYTPIAQSYPSQDTIWPRLRRYD